MTNGEKIVTSVERWLSDGPLGDRLNGDAYRRLISCGFVPALRSGGDIGTVHTSCAIFVRAILHDAEVLPASGPARIGWPMWGGWLGELSPRHKAWVPYKSGSKPVPGAVFYIESPANPNNNHVGIFLAENPDGTWDTAEGGGGDGTRCGYGARKIERNQSGRKLIGWFDPELIDFERKATDPAMPAVRGA
jgi:hypothetical protein